MTPFFFSQFKMLKNLFVMLTHINHTSPLVVASYPSSVTTPVCPKLALAVILPGQELGVPSTMEVTCVSGTAGHGPARPRALPGGDHTQLFNEESCTYSKHLFLTPPPQI